MANNSKQRNWHVYTEIKGQPTHLQILGGHSKLTLAEATWLYKEYKAGRFIGYRKRYCGPKAKPLTLQERAWREAERLVGVMEDPGHNNEGHTGVVTVNEIITENHGSIGEPWCGDFDYHCYHVAGSKAISRAWASANALGTLGGMKAINPKNLTMGDIVVFQFAPGEFHTGIFGFWCNSAGHPVAYAEASYMCTIEGNTSSTGAVSDSRTGGDGVYRKIDRTKSELHRAVRVLR